MDFLVVLEEDEHGVVADVPLLPGCHTQGRTREEALENIKDAIALYLQGGDVPKGTTVTVEHVSVEG